MGYGSYFINKCYKTKMKFNTWKRKRTLEAKDIIAIVVIVGGFTLLALGIDTVVGGILIAVTSYYFRKRME